MFIRGCQKHNLEPSTFNGIGLADVEMTSSQNVVRYVFMQRITVETGSIYSAYGYVVIDLSVFSKKWITAENDIQTDTMVLRFAWHARWRHRLDAARTAKMLLLPMGAPIEMAMGEY
jgi:hypothetical protein